MATLGLGLASPVGNPVGDDDDGSIVDGTLGTELGTALESNEGRSEELELGCDEGVSDS